MLIGDLADPSGVGVETVRCYERQGLLREPPPSGGVPAARRRRACDDVAECARRKIEIVDDRIRDLKRIRRVLDELVNSCSGRRRHMSGRNIDLVYFDGCPNAEAARAILRALLPERPWREWNLSSADTPEQFRRYGSPTILVDGRDVTGENGATGAMACRADGAPSLDAIRKALSDHG